MKKETARRERKNAIATIVLFLLILTVLTGLSLTASKKKVSEMENRRLAEEPNLTLQTISEGSWATDMQSFVQDHIAGRDWWIDLCSSVETSCFRKKERAGILLGHDGWMFQKRFGSENMNQSRFNENIDQVVKFADRYKDRVTVMLVPSADLIYRDKLPEGAPQIDEDTLLNTAFSALKTNCNVIDLREVFQNEKENTQLYYKTDHHWTTDGAYAAYQEYCRQKKLSAFCREERTRCDVPDFFGTHYSASRWNCAQGDTLSYYLLENPMTVFQINGENQYTPLKPSELMNLEKLKKVDKYGAFLDGNHGYTEISGNGTGKILVVKDSYANCFVPFLTENYKTIGVVDFRNFTYGLDSTIEAKGYDDILLLYSFYNFMDDSHLIYLNRPSVINK